MASTSSIRPASTTSNKEDLSILDDVLFNKFVDGDQFDFSDSSYGRSASATSGDSWFDGPSSGAIEVTGQCYMDNAYQLFLQLTKMQHHRRIPQKILI